LKRLITYLTVAAALAVLSFGSLGCPGTASCKAYQAGGFSGQSCGGRAGYLWNGISCIYGNECVCTGEDCQRVFATQDSCETAHIHCPRN
jgi:hypothetical protein